jgi:hypothetical protein
MIYNIFRGFSRDARWILAQDRFVYVQALLIGRTWGCTLNMNAKYACNMHTTYYTYNTIYIYHTYSHSLYVHTMYTLDYILYLYIYSIYRILKYPVTWCKSMKPEALAQLHGFTVRRQDCSGPHSRRSRLWRRHWFPARGAWRNRMEGSLEMILEILGKFQWFQCDFKVWK